MSIVRRAEKRSLREASCCSVEVVNGGGGLRRTSFFSRSRTAKPVARWACSTIRLASASLPSANLSSFSPFTPTSFAVMTSPLVVVKSASMVQYSRAVKPSISSSRSQIRRSATDCTRPAEREPGSLRHSTGESVKPTR